MAQLTLSGDTSGSVGIVVPAVAGSNTATVPAQTGTLGMIAQGTAVATTSGTSVTFTGIPSWVKRITVMFNEVSLSGTANFLIQIGSGSVTTTGYISTTGVFFGGSVAQGSSTSGFIVNTSNAAAYNTSGAVVLNNLSGNIWICTGSTKQATNVSSTNSGTVTLSGTLDRVVLTTTNGTDTFDAGSVNILYEG